MIEPTNKFQDWLNQTALDASQKLVHRGQVLYGKLQAFAAQEILAPVTESQVNQALKQFVVDNVDAIMDMHLELHDGWLRLYVVAKYQDIFAHLAVNLTLVHVQLDRYRQRLVFGQISDTQVLSLYTSNYLKSSAIRAAIWGFHRVLKRDPLGLILGKLGLVKQKQDILYLDLGRWLKKNEKIMSALHKAQVNHGLLAEDQLLLKASINMGDVLSFASTEEVITEADNPAKQPAKPTKQADNTDKSTATPLAEQSPTKTLYQPTHIDEP